MKETYGSLWKFYGKPGYTVLITTNGFVRNDGCAVMGRGCALEASKRLPTLSKMLGSAIKKYGNVVRVLSPDGKSTPKEKKILTFPVKRAWYEDADPELIRESALTLKTIAEHNPKNIFVLPRPGCGNGRLLWENVKPLLTDLPDNVRVITHSKDS